MFSESCHKLRYRSG